MSHTARIERLLLAEIVLPDWHPRFADGSCQVFGYAVRHPDGVILFDTGVGTGSSFIEDFYRPHVIRSWKHSRDTGSTNVTLLRS